MVHRTSVTRIRPDSTSLARGMLIAAASLVGLVAISVGSPTFADEPAEATVARGSDTDEMSERQRRREERRRAREAEDAADAASRADTAAAPDESAFVVYVAPEIECRMVQVTGSRMPKEVCQPVHQAAQDEQDAQDFLRRTRELSTVVPEDERTNPFITPSVFN